MELTEILKIVIYPVMLFLFAIFFTVFFRSQLRELLQKIIVRFKKGDTEFEVRQQVIESKPELEKQIAGNSISKPIPQEETPKVLDSDSKSPDELLDEMISAIFDGELDKGETIYKKLQESERDPVEKSRREGIYYYYLYQRGNTSALSKIIELTKNPDVSHYAHYWLGLCYETSQDFDKALIEYKLAVQKAKSQERRAIYVVSCARSLQNNGKTNDALQYIMEEIASTTESNALSDLYSGLAFLYLKDENYELRGLALEKAIEHEPNNTNLLFQVAYSYSQVNHNELSLLYYNTLLHFSPEHEMALNNIGVAYSRLSMPIKSIDYHKKAFDLGNTLSASNIALSYIGGGFADEAMQILEKAREQKDIHRNVGSTFAEISDKKEQEQKREKESLESARELQRFMRSFGEAYFVKTSKIPDVGGTWVFPDGTEVIISQEKEVLKVEWKENKQTYGLRGVLVNRAAQITITAPSYSVKEGAGSKLYISPDYQSIHLMIKRYSRFEYKKLGKKQDEAIPSS